MLKNIQSLINAGLSAYHIQQVLRADGHRVYCFGSYYTVGRGARMVCFYETDNGPRCNYVRATSEA
jgi:hypothetical protein